MFSGLCFDTLLLQPLTKQAPLAQQTHSNHSLTYVTHVRIFWVPGCYGHYAAYVS